jgi:hypothetical protein
MHRKSGEARKDELSMIARGKFFSRGPGHGMFQGFSKKVKATRGGSVDPGLKSSVAGCYRKIK